MNNYEKQRQKKYDENFAKSEWASAFCLYNGEKGGISYRVTLKNGTEIKSGNWSNIYDQNGTWVIPYTKPRMEKDVTQGKLRTKYK